MNKPCYAFEQSKDSLTYKFWSIGTKGVILKAVIFQQVSLEVFNIVLGDYDEETETMDDKTITDNGDISKIIATVVQSIVNFFETYPDKLIYIEGNQPIKQKLYQRTIKNNLNDFSTSYNLFGVLPNEEVEAFRIDQDYIAFIIQQK